MTDEKAHALITELRSAAGAGREGTHAGYSPLLRGADLATRAADALEALTVPDEDARERLRKVVARGAFEDFADYPLDGENALVERVTEAILAAFPVISRAAAPEPEWEYVIVNGRGVGLYMAYSLREALEGVARDQGGPGLKPARSIKRRRAAGPWEPLPVGGETDAE